MRVFFFSLDFEIPVDICRKVYYYSNKNEQTFARHCG
jgi:hypothetical protein